MVCQTLQRRARWLSRRGLLELDILLSKFLASPLFETLSDKELAIYIQILEWQDHDLLDILQGTKSHRKSDVRNIIQKIKFCSKIG
ncbi:MAG: succinate dehydrogenase assembly factor 2 family protein [Neisseriaceae bacterium]|nr:MAG: succinate dehydrogenase assembly factor 2 family protein [Neisseriaceae bacterium]